MKTKEKGRGGGEDGNLNDNNGISTQGEEEETFLPSRRSFAKGIFPLLSRRVKKEKKKHFMATHS